MSPSRHNRWLIVVPTLLSVSLVIAQVYYARVEKPLLAERLRKHDAIIAGNALSPYRYRVLVPFTAATIARVIESRAAHADAVRWAYRACDVISIASLLTLLFVWLREWFSEDQALVGVLFVAATISIALQDHDFQPWSVPEAALFTAALLAIWRRQYAWLAVVTITATLNRETAIFIPAALVAGRIDVAKRVITLQRETLIVAAALTTIWLAGFMGLRVARGSAPLAAELDWLFQWNRDPESLHRAATNWTLFFGAFWVFAALGSGRAPTFVRRLWWLVPPYLVTVAVWGVWFEVRLLLMLYPVLLPLALSFMYEPKAGTSPDARMIEL